MKRLYETFLTGEKKNSVKTKINSTSQIRNIMKINCFFCHNLNHNLQDVHNFENDTLIFPNNYGSFQNYIDENKIIHQVKKLYSSEQISCKYNYFVNKLL